MSAQFTAPRLSFGYGDNDIRGRVRASDSKPIEDDCLNNILARLVSVSVHPRYELRRGILRLHIHNCPDSAISSRKTHLMRAHTDPIRPTVSIGRLGAAPYNVESGE